MISIFYLIYIVNSCITFTQFRIEVTQSQPLQTPIEITQQSPQQLPSQQSPQQSQQQSPPQQSQQSQQQSPSQQSPPQQSPPQQIINQGIIPTYYFRINDDIPNCAPVQNFDNGFAFGPCNGGQGVFYNKNSKYWVAINNAKSYCGKQIKVNYKTDSDRTNSLILTVMDECPGCGNSKIDMSLEALVELTGSIDIACSINRPQPQITWEFI